MKNLDIKSFAFLYIILVCTNISSGQGIGNVTGINLNQNTLTLNAGLDVVVFKVCTEKVLMVNYKPQGNEDPDTLVVGNTNWQIVPASIDTSGDPIRILTSSFKIEINKYPMRFKAYSSNGSYLFGEPLYKGLSQSGIILNIQPGNFYGIHNKDAGSLTTNGGTINAGMQGQAGAPFVWTTNGWGMIADVDSGAIYFSGNELSFLRKVHPNKRDIELYFTFGNPKEIINGMTDVTGKPPLFPKYSLGFLNTEWGMNEAELISDVQTYRSKQIPLDVYILDFDWMDWGANNYGEFRFGNKFPSAPGGQLKNTLLQQGVKLFGIRKPRIHVNTIQGQYCISNNFFSRYETDYFSGQLVGILNFHIPTVRDWFWNSFANIGNSYNNGIVGYWNDEADTYNDNMLFMQMQRSLYEGQRQYNNKRIWSINRNFFLGAQRYAYALWSGDIQTGFSSMARQKTFMISSILLGASWWGMDIGGFNGTPTPECYYRWIQFGAFVPVFRVHGTLNQEREPWNYGTQAEEIAKKFIRLRYSLIPYIYSAAWENHLTGLSIVRPLIIEYPNDVNAVNNSNEWLFGNDLLVHPVVAGGVNSIDVYLPQGVWIDFWNGKFYYGPSTVNYKVDPTIIPLFVKAGSVLPMAPVGKFVDDSLTSNLIKLVCYPEGDGSSVIYDDDGESYNYENGIFSKTEFVHFNNLVEDVLEIEPRSGNYIPNQRDYLAEFLYMIDEPDTVYLDNSILLKTSPDSVINFSITRWAFDQSNSKCLVRLNDDGGYHKIKIVLQKDITPPSVDSVYFENDTSINVKFNERIQVGPGTNSAENPLNYSLSGGLQVIEAKAAPTRDEIQLKISRAQPNVNYTITISGIADVSPFTNIINPVQFTIKFKNYVYYKIILQQGLNGYSGSKDTHIAEYFPDNNMGGYQFFEVCRFAGNYSNDDKSALIHFDLTSIPQTADTLIDAFLVLTLAGTRNGYASKQISGYRLLKPWGEGNIATGFDGAPAQYGMATWNSAKHGQMLWNNPGGDAVESPSDVVQVENSSEVNYRWNITSFVKFWLSYPDSNYGLLLKESFASSLNGTKVFYSKEHFNLSNRPKIELRYRSEATSNVENLGNLYPQNFFLKQNFPNPFNPLTKISYGIPRDDFVTIKIYSITGELVETLEAEYKRKGFYEKVWNADKYTTGVYIYVMKAGEFYDYKKCLLLK